MFMFSVPNTYLNKNVFILTKLYYNYITDCQGFTAQDKYVHNAYYAKYRCMEMSRMYFHDIWTSQILTVFTEIKAKYR